MTQDQDHSSLDAAKGRAPVTWDIWSEFIDRSEELTTEGRALIRETVQLISAYLGNDWPGRVSGQGRRPLIHQYWWGNAAPHVMRRILTLGCQLELLADSPGVGHVRKLVSGDVGHFDHWLIQLEVAGLARRADWTVALEPRADEGRADLLLSRSADSVLVEAKWFDEPMQFRADTMRGDRLMMWMLKLEGEFDVSLVSELPADMTDEDVEALVDELREYADAAKRSRISVEHHPRSGGVVRVYPEPNLPGARHSIQVRQGDHLRRLASAIEQKAEQARGPHPLWLRFDKPGIFWFSGRGDSPLEFHTRLACWLKEHLDAHDHVAGIMLANSAVTCTRAEIAHTLDGRGISMVQPTNPPMGRESLFVAGSHPSAIPQLTEWAAWYASEPSWLEWALSELGKPGLDEVLEGIGPA